jgi:GPH family glycoside/pentoside/hexuronide:cation symporter
MSLVSHHVTAAEDKISFGQKAAYGSGQFANMVLALSVSALAYPILNIELGMNVALVGVLLMIPRFWDAFTDPLIGYLSDKTRSRFGRRKPFMLVGAISVAIILALMWQIPRDWSTTGHFCYFLGFSLLFYLAYTVFVTPYMALGFELTADYHERTRLMAVMQFIGQVGAIPMAWVFALSERDIFANRLEGAQVVNIGLAVIVILLAMGPILLLRDPTIPKYRERKAEPDQPGVNPFQSFFSGLWLTLKNKNFLLLCGTTFFFFAGHIIAENMGRYLGIYYLYNGDTEQASVLTGYMGTLWPVLSLASIPFMTWMSGRLGKRKAFIICISAALLGHIIKWFCWNPELPYLILLPTPLTALGFGALWTLLASMLADVCDEDELSSGERREGVFTAAYWWIVKLGMAASFGIAGVVLDLSGFDESLEGAQGASTILAMRIFDMALPIALTALAILLIKHFALTEEKAYEIKSLLEKRRGELAPGA